MSLFVLREGKIWFTVLFLGRLALMAVAASSGFREQAPEIISLK